MYIVCYDPASMMPSFTAEHNKFVTLEFFEEKGHSCFLSENGNIQNKYVENDELVSMIEFNTDGVSTDIALGEDFVLTDLPSPTTVIIDGSVMGEVTDGVLEFEAEDVGRYEITLLSPPKYMDKKIEVTFS